MFARPWSLQTDAGQNFVAPRFRSPAISPRLAAYGLPMKREFPEIPLVGVGAIIIEGPRVVLVKRAHPPLQAEWSIPGGVLEVGELVRDAAAREAREETGLVVEPVELLGVYDRVLRNPEQRVQYHYVLIDFLCRRVAGDLAAASDAAEVRWFTREELPGLRLAEDTLDVIAKGFEKVAAGR
jgi:8-oxo-dGTP diphosphatase